MKKTLTELDRETQPPVKLTEHDQDKVKLDTEQVFLLFTTFAGDIDKTAAALGCPAKYIAHLAESEGWAERIKGIIELRKSKKPGDMERAINRAISFVQAHRYRCILERTLRRMKSMTDAELEEFLLPTQYNPGKVAEGEERGTHRVFKTRALADFAVALEKAHFLCYAALCDQITERNRRKENDDQGELSLTAIHAQLARGMAQAAQPVTGEGELAATQIEMAQETAKGAAEINRNPYDSDEH